MVIKSKKVVIIWLILAIMLILSSMMVLANSHAKANKFNVVFVIDGSGSMLQTDPFGWRFEATDLFLGLLTEKGNRVGGFVFDDSILSKCNLGDINNMSNKQVVSAALKHTNPVGYTDIGLGLLEATTMLDENRNPELPSVIILLTDGETYLTNKGESTYDKSSKNKAAAIQSARDNKYPVYGVALNANKKANLSEVKDITDSTGGKYFEVNRAEDLIDVFNEFYALIYGDNAKLVGIGAGYVKEQFTVPPVGVEEVNIIIYSPNKIQSLSLIQPSGVALSQDEINALRMDGKTFSVIKILSPMSGTWQLEATGTTDEEIKIVMVRNIDLMVESSITEPKDSYTLGTTLHIKTEIYSKKVLVTDSLIYSSFKSYISHVDRNGVENKVEAVFKNDAYFSDLKLDSYGTSYLTAIIASDDLVQHGNTITINVVNLPPIPYKQVIKKQFVILPHDKTEKEIDLTKMVKDPEGDKLFFKIEKTTYAKDRIRLKNNKIIISSGPDAKNTISVFAEDSQGAAVTFDIEVKIINIFQLLCRWILIFLILIILMTVFIMINRAYKKFYGFITVVVFNQDSGLIGTPQTVQPIRGIVPLSKIMNVNVDLSGRFVATGKNYIWFKSSKPFYAGGFKKVKKTKISHDYETVISRDEIQRKGIRVRFISNLEQT